MAGEPPGGPDPEAHSGLSGRNPGRNHKNPGGQPGHRGQQLSQPAGERRAGIPCPLRQAPECDPFVSVNKKIKSFLLFSEKIRKKHELSKNNIFSLTRELNYKNLDFEKSLDLIDQSELLIGGKYVEMNKYDEVIHLLNENKLELSNLMRLFDVLFNKAKVRQNWDVILSCLKSYKLCIKRKFIRQFFTIVSEENNKNEHKDNRKDCNLFLDNIKFLFKEYNIMFI